MRVDAPEQLETRPSAGEPVLDLRGHEIDLALIAPLLEGIITRWHPLQIWLFGSRARGEATEESDWDLFIVVPDETREEEFDPLIVWQIRRRARVRADLIPCFERDFLAYRDTAQSLAYEAAHQGVLIYER